LSSTTSTLTVLSMRNIVAMRRGGGYRRTMHWRVAVS
jgi:hypothetical protein